MMMKGPLREFLPLPAQQVTVRLPEGKTCRAVKLLASAQTPRVQLGTAQVRLTVPAILDHEVVAIDF
jgi:hypothetical protein